MTNSDPFDHPRRVRDTHTHKTVAVMRLQFAALTADLDDMLQARRVDDLAPGAGLAAGGGRNTNPADPTANAALNADRAAERWAEWDLAFAELAHALRTATRVRHATLANPTPTNLCRHGDCPEKRTADRGTGAKDGTPRCHACYSFWLKDASNPGERRERDRVGQSPRRVGLEQGAVA